MTEAITVGQLVEQLLEYDAELAVGAVAMAGTESFALLEVVKVDPNPGKKDGVPTTLPLLVLAHPRLYDRETHEPLPMAMLMVDD